MNDQTQHIARCIRTRTGILQKAAILDARAYCNAILDAEHILLSDILTPEEENCLVNSGNMNPIRQLSSRLFSEFESVLERSFVSVFLRANARPLLLNNDGNITQPYLLRYQQLARAEVSLAEITAADRVAFVGSGPFPISAIEYVRQTHCHVDGYECRPDAVALSCDVLRHLDLKTYLQVIQQTGETADYSSYSVILVGVLAQPKAVIFDRIYATASPYCRILCRTTQGLRTFIYPPTSEDAWRNHYNCEQCVRAQGQQTLSCLRLAPKGGIR
jgi:hypothetical protein